MEKYDDLSVVDICNNGVKTILEKKDPNDWTEYDATLAYIHNISIPDGKMPKELLIHALLTADEYTALALIKRSEANEYREEAVNLFIDRYCSNWVNRYLSGNTLKSYEDPVEEAKRSLMWTIYKWLYTQNIQITWSNITKVFVIYNKMNKKSAIEILEYIAKTNNEQIPDYVMSIVNKMPES